MLWIGPTRACSLTLKRTHCGGPSGGSALQTQTKEQQYSGRWSKPRRALSRYILIDTLLKRLRFRVIQFSPSTNQTSSIMAAIWTIICRLNSEGKTISQSIKAQYATSGFGPIWSIAMACLKSIGPNPAHTAARSPPSPRGHRGYTGGSAANSNSRSRCILPAWRGCG